MFWVASWSFSGRLETNDSARLAHFDIEAPTNGHLMLSGSLQFYTAEGTELIWCSFELDGEQVTSATTHMDVYDPTPGIRGSCNTEGVVPVAAGNHTITVMGTHHDLLDTYFSWGSARALFVPFGPSGEQPVVLSLPAVPPEQLP